VVQSKVNYEVENNYKSINLWLWDKRKLLFEILVTRLILYGCEVWGCKNLVLILKILLHINLSEN